MIKTVWMTVVITVRMTVTSCSRTVFSWLIFLLRCRGAAGTFRGAGAAITHYTHYSTGVQEFIISGAQYFRSSGAQGPDVWVFPSWGGASGGQ